MKFQSQTKRKSSSPPNLQSFDTFQRGKGSIVARSGLWMIPALLRHFEQALSGQAATCSRLRTPSFLPATQGQLQQAIRVS